MVAFANTYGGTVYFGLNEAGVPLGVDDFDEIERSIFSFARNGVNPDMSSSYVLRSQGSGGAPT